MARKVGRALNALAQFDKICVTRLRLIGCVALLLLDVRPAPDARRPD